MTLETFWQLIDDVRQASSRLVEVPQRLTDLLCRMDEQEIVDFESHYIDCLHRSYDARLWLVGCQHAPQTRPWSVWTSVACLVHYSLLCRRRIGYPADG